MAGSSKSTEIPQNAAARGEGLLDALRALAVVIPPLRQRIIDIWEQPILLVEFPDKWQEHFLITDKSIAFVGNTFAPRRGLEVKRRRRLSDDDLVGGRQTPNIRQWG